VSLIFGLWARGKGIVSQSSGERRGEEALLLLFLGVLVCLAFLNSPGTEDRSEWLRYMGLARQYGVLGAYPNAGPVDYPPLSFVLLGLLARVADVFRISDFIAVKISLMVLTLACAAVAAALPKQWQPVLAVAMFLTLVVDAMLEVYIDAYFIVSLLLALFCFERGYLSLGTAFFAFASLTKWQPIILTPLILLYVIPRRPAPVDLVRLAPAAGLSLIVLFMYGVPMMHAFIEGFENARLSGQAMNLNWLLAGFVELQHPHRDGLINTISYSGDVFVSTFPDDPPVPITRTIAALLSVSSVLRYFCYLVSLYYFFISDRSLLNLVRASTICFMCYFMFGYGAHENHGCIPAVLGICWFALDRTRFLEATMLAVTFNMNLLIFYGLHGAGLAFSRIVGWDVTLYFAAFNLILFLVLWLPVANTIRSHIVGLVSRIGLHPAERYR
jgi:hypothetical protein